jgi:type IV pilus assembly protein PilE
MRKTNGFTLMELVMVVVIIGILGTLGIPIYTKTIEKSRQGEAMHWLGTLRESEERYRQENSAYTTTIGNLDIDAPPSSATGPNYFTYSVTTATATTFTAQATRTGYQAPSGATGYTITIDQVGTITRDSNW